MSSHKLSVQKIRITKISIEFIFRVIFLMVGEGYNHGTRCFKASKIYKEVVILPWCLAPVMFYRFLKLFMIIQSEYIMACKSTGKPSKCTITVLN